MASVSVRIRFYSNSFSRHFESMRAGPTMAIGRAYCSTANLGAGFDVFGLALDKFSDTTEVLISRRRGIRISATGPFGRGIPRDPRKNSAGPPASALLKKAREKRGLLITINKRIPPGVGLGSSGATAAACTKTVGHILGLKLSPGEMVKIASLGEKAVAGSPHADNVAASLLGGFTAVYGETIRVVNLSPPANLIAVVAIPSLTTAPHKTKKARSLVPKRVDTKSAILNIGRASAIVAGFAKGDIDAIGSGMLDEIAEPNRERVIPGATDARKLALDAGAAGVAISGAGPSLIAIFDNRKHDPVQIGRAMVAGFHANKVRSKWFVTRPAPGAKIIKEE